LIPLTCHDIIEQQHGHGVRALATATAMATAMAMDRRMFHVYNHLLRYSNYLASFLASAHLEVHQKERKNGHSICTTQIQICKYTNKKMVILYAYLRIGVKKTPILQNKYANASF
jgi:hypothetical protein